MDHSVSTTLEAVDAGIAALESGEDRDSLSELISQGSESDGSSHTRNPTPDVSRILGLSVPLSVSLAERDMPLGSILAMNVGTIIEFGIPFDADLVLRVGDQPIAKGRAIKVGENFGLRISGANSTFDRINALRR